MIKLAWIAYLYKYFIALKNIQNENNIKGAFPCNFKQYDPRKPHPNMQALTLPNIVNSMNTNQTPVPAGSNLTMCNQ
jgi:hypothetical protein